MKNKTLLLSLLLLLGSCSKNNSQPEAPTPKEELSATWHAGLGQFNGTLDFGNLVDSATKLLSVSVKNVGESTLVGPMQIQGGDFSLVYSSCDQILPGKSCLIKVSFNPENKNNQVYTATLTMGSSQANVSASVNLPAIMEELSASLGGIPISGTVDFGIIKYDQSVIKTITIVNHGQKVGPLTVSKGGTDFVINHDSCSGKLLDEKNSCSIKVSLSGAGKSGIISDTLTIGQVFIPLTATVKNLETVSAEESDIKLLVNNIAPVSGALDLGTWNIGQTKILNIYLKNQGTDSGIVQLPGFDSSLQLVINHCTDGKILFPNENCLVKFVTIPQTKGVFSSQLNIQGGTFNIQSIIRAPGDKIYCPMDNADESYITWSGTSYSQCQIELCDTNYHLTLNQCDPDVISCPISNGSGLQTWDGSVYSSCELDSCNSGFHEFNNQCDSNVISCSILNGEGTQTWNGTNYDSCLVSTCNSNFHQEGNSCVTDIKTVTITQPTAGQGSISGPSTATYNSSVSFTYTPNLPYVLSSWGDSCSGSANTCTINPVLNDLTVSATIACTSGYTMVSNVCLRNINLTISANTQNYNLFTAASSPTDKVLVNLTINGGVVVGASSASNTALSIGGGWSSGSIINLVNNGTIAGAGGKGGNGSDWAAPGENGFPGGNALVVNYALSITNNGIIGGGGGGGGGASGFSNGGNYCRSGGGGGGGAGNIVGAGGLFSSCGGRPYDNPGSAGTLSTGGNGGPSITDGPRTSGVGGKGGDLGQNGAAGGQSFGSGSWGLPLPGQGGAAGKAVISNGFSINWISGNDAAHIKGAIQ